MTPSALRREREWLSHRLADLALDTERFARHAEETCALGGIGLRLTDALHEIDGARQVLTSILDRVQP